jgi:hypothetical protein
MLSNLISLFLLCWWATRRLQHRAWRDGELMRSPEAGLAREALILLQVKQLRCRQVLNHWRWLTAITMVR